MSQGDWWALGLITAVTICFPLLGILSYVEIIANEFKRFNDREEK